MIMPSSIANYSIETEERTTYTLLRVKGRFVGQAADDVRKAADKIVGKGEKRVGFDLSNTLSLDSGSIGLILGLYKRLKGQGGEVLLVGISSQVRPAIDAAGLLRQVTYYATAEDAELEEEEKSPIDQEERATYLLLRIPAEFKASTIHPVREAVRKALDAGHSNIAFQLENASYMDSVAIGLLMNVHKRLRQREGSVSLISVSPEIKRLLDTTNVSRVLPQYATIEEADDEIL